jgi:uncharacterized membrane protein YoaK (UPF0700 family)
VVGFVVGCAAGSALEVHCGLWALTLPAALAVAAVPLGEFWSDGQHAQQKLTRSEVCQPT